MKSIFTLLFVFLFLSVSVFAKKVDVADAKKAAKTFVQHIDGLAKKPNDLNLVFTSTTLASPFTSQTRETTPFYYVFNFEGANGFIIISADDAVVPVLAYSTEKKYRLENQADPFIKWMDKYRKEIQEIISKQLIAGDKIEQQWTRLKNGLSMNVEKNKETVSQLLSTTWDQMQYYHELCPYDNDYNQYVATGCVATAMAQVMKYHNYPQNGEGYHTYNHSKYGSLSANFGAETYNWSAMPNNVTSNNNSVATLMYHCGVGLEMNYGPAQTGGSSTNSLDVVANALKSYFSYSSSTQFTMRQTYTDANWKNLLKDELNNSRPMEYAGVGQGGGHAFVCDGYDASDYFHFNWGWSGYYDGYFHMDQLNPGTGGTGAGAGNYNQYQQIVYGIQPETSGGGGGTTPPGEGSPLFFYSALSVSPNPIDFFSAFSVSIDVANTSGAAYTCDLTAAIFNSDGTNVGFVETKTGLTLDNGYFYSYEFSTEGMPVTPGSYTIGIYSRASGEEWAAVKNGDYSNNIPVIINGPSNDIALYSAMAVSPDPIIQGEGLTISVDVANYGSYFSGTISADIYTSQGEYEALVEEVEGVTLSNNTYGTATFTTSSINVEPGTYIIALWNLPDGGTWSLMGSSNDYPNPITIKVVAPGIQEDSYENNDTEANAYVFSALSNTHTYTTGSNTHVGNDFDYYKFNLDANFKYRISARVHDSYNSGNGTSYTNDVIFSYNQGNGAGEGYDDVLPADIIVNGKSSISFFVASYFVGQTGTYLLDVDIVKIGAAGINDIDAVNSLSIYPNPSKDYLHIEISENSQMEIAEGFVYNACGQMVYTLSEDEKNSKNFDINTSQLESGTYLLRIEHAEGMITRKFNVIK